MNYLLLLLMYCKWHTGSLTQKMRDGSYLSKRECWCSTLCSDCRFIEKNFGPLFSAGVGAWDANPPAGDPPHQGPHWQLDQPISQKLFLPSPHTSISCFQPHPYSTAVPLLAGFSIHIGTSFENSKWIIWSSISLFSTPRP